MSESPPPRPRVPPSTPSSRQPPPHDGSTPALLEASEGPLGGYANSAEVKAALIFEFEKCITTLPCDLVHLNALFMRHGIDEAVVQGIFAALPDAVYSNGRWRIPEKPHLESELYGPFSNILNYVFSHIPSDPAHPPLNRRWAYVSANQPQQQANDSQRPSSKPETVIKTRPDVIVLGEDPRLLPGNLSLRDYQRAIVVGELKREKDAPEDSSGAMETIRAQLGAYARYVLALFPEIIL